MCKQEEEANSLCAQRGIPTITTNAAIPVNTTTNFDFNARLSAANQFDVTVRIDDDTGAHQDVYAISYSVGGSSAPIGLTLIIQGKTVNCLVGIPVAITPYLTNHEGYKKGRVYVCERVSTLLQCRLKNSSAEAAKCGLIFRYGNAPCCSEVILFPAAREMPSNRLSAHPLPLRTQKSKQPQAPVPLAPARSEPPARPPPGAPYVFGLAFLREHDNTPEAFGAVLVESQKEEETRTKREEELLKKTSDEDGDIFIASEKIDELHDSHNCSYSLLPIEREVYFLECGHTADMDSVMQQCKTLRKGGRDQFLKCFRCGIPTVHLRRKRGKATEALSVVVVPSSSSPSSPSSSASASASSVSQHSGQLNILPRKRNAIEVIDLLD